jgi:hypothetical protein
VVEGFPSRPPSGAGPDAPNGVRVRHGGTIVRLPIHASWPNPVEIPSHRAHRTVIGLGDFADLEQLARRPVTFPGGRRNRWILRSLAGEVHVGQ